MPRSTRTSRFRFRDYLQQARERRSQKEIVRDIVPDAAAEARRKYKRHRSFFKLFVKFVELLGRHQRVVAIALASLTFSTTLALATPYGSKLIFDHVLDSKPLPSLLQPYLGTFTARQLLTAVVVTMISLSTISLLINVWSRWNMTLTTKRMQVKMRRITFDHAVRLPLHRVYGLKSGGVASLLRDDAGAVAELLFGMIYNPWKAITQLLGTLCILAWIDWRLLVASAVLLPLVYYSHQIWISRIRPIYRDIRATRTSTDAHATEAFGGMRVVRGFGRHRTEAATFTRNNDLLARQELFAWWWSRGIDIAWSILIPCATALLLWYGGNRILTDAQLVAAGQLDVKKAFTIGELVMFLTYLAWLLGPLELLANSAAQFQNSLAALDRVLDILAEPVDMPNRPGARILEPDKVEGALTLQGVTFAYPGTTDAVIRDVDVHVEPGEMVALVGRSGAGKTTFCNLVARFYDPTSGRVLLDGLDLRDIDVDSFRRLLGIVEQDIFLFDGTISDNISYSRRHATRKEIEYAAQLSNAHEFIAKLPQGYDTLVGERGVKLSGGQRQRISIARALLADPHILILDEATSNLDTESERMIQTSLQTLMSGRTSFVIAHRLSTIAHADRILVMENGRIVEQGRHEELMAHSGRYRDMVDLQTKPVQPLPAEPTPQPAA